ncbi:MAG: ferric reductase like protein transmembrane component family protein [Candidatus Gottesmanbacteria bacterium GW2011_GWA2_43_14]|uniref:Ferric reductase like protein transmembrane component family protein n=1 Tax=Candidatus Gottesmanbacteria bacterium GW2011_GWA2_43_14 TaxID=1618443 RepID=A0A0G1FN84_9BACT|nr:MAG: ferric reductase like protein transmembrane component family protein [Candidatus Gottesmanbacteria bacterium GW2011_GWA2_43_14]
MPASLVEQIFAFSVSRRKLILSLFQILYALLSAAMVLGIRAAVTGNNYLFFYNLALLSGKISVIIFCLVMVPGIARRFGIRSKLVFPLMIYRRYMGISMFLFALFHASVIRLVSFAQDGFPFSSLLLFELSGLTALFFLFFMFLTSNDFSVKYLKFWWHRLHKLIYIIMWLILFHVGLQRISVWTLLMAAAVTLQVASYFYSRRSR